MEPTIEFNALGVGCAAEDDDNETDAPQVGLLFLLSCLARHLHLLHVLNMLPAVVKYVISLVLWHFELLWSSDIIIIIIIIIDNTPLSPFLFLHAL